MLREVSLVARGAVKGAEITSRRAMPPAPVEQKLPPEPARPPVELVHQDDRPVLVHRKPAVIARHLEEDREMRRRLDWLLRMTGRYDLEAVVAGMQRELHGQSIHDLGREYGLAGVG